MMASTERGIMEPQATFSTCFGGAFMTLHPTEYADLLKNKLQEHNTHVYQINTGCTAGVYSVGKRMKLSFTSKCVDAVTSKMPFSMDRIDTSMVPPPRSKISTLQALPPVPGVGVQTVSDGSSRGLVNDTLDFQTSDRTGILGRLTLLVAEVERLGLSFMPISNMDEISSGVKLLFSPVNSTSVRTLSLSARLLNT
ncbi:hypothetical protein V7S43_004618 [Phytophthora oleae]|uniref:Uncharacterized protein n=1 Tax=Phytophthora oleae TaxID=2107226 RepID=A0ABD3FTR1_9STRA